VSRVVVRTIFVGRVVVSTVAVMAGVAWHMPMATAAALSGTLVSNNGEGVVDNSLLCGSGDGPSWRYGYTGPVTPTFSPLAGGWAMTVEVHRTGAGGFIPDGTGRLHITANRGGTATLAFHGGSCTGGPLSLVDNTTGDTTTASGSLPFTVTNGTGPLRALTGTGTLGLSFEMGPGGGNHATVALTGSLTALSPNFAIGVPTSHFASIIDYLSGRLTVNIPITNLGPTATTGDLFGVRITSASATGHTLTGAPVDVGTVLAGTTRLVPVVVSGVLPLTPVTLNIHAVGVNALDEAVPDAAFAGAITAPLLPDLVLL